MRAAERKEFERRIEILEWEKAELHKNYVNAVKDTVKEFCGIMLSDEWVCYFEVEIVKAIAKECYGVELKYEPKRTKRQGNTRSDTDRHYKDGAAMSRCGLYQVSIQSLGRGLLSDDARAGVAV